MIWKSYRLELKLACCNTWTVIGYHDYYSFAKDRKTLLIPILGKYRVRIIRYTYKNKQITDVKEIK